VRIAVGELKHEANTFSPVPTTVEHFQSEHLLRRENVLTSLAHTNTELWGFVERALTLKCSLLPLIAASALSGGPLSPETYLFLKEQLLHGLEAAGPVDGVFLALHGAMVAQVSGGEDATGLLLREVRTLVGDDTPIIATVDLHANVTEQMVSAATALIGYRSWPHIDQAQRGQEAADLLVATLRGEVHPVTALSKLRMVLQVEKGQTDSGPMAELLRRARAWEAERKCISASIFLVQPWLDLPEMGCAIIIVADGDKQLAQRLADELGQEMWNLRHAFDVQLVAIGEAIDRATRAPGKPVVLADSADSTGSGAPGDSTAILQEILGREVACRVLLPVVDKEAVQAAYSAGSGASLRVSLGGKLDSVFNSPVDVDAVIEWLGLASFHFEGPFLTGLEVQMGRVAVLRVRDIHIVVSAQPTWTVDPAMYRAVGLEPSEAQIVVVKSPNLFRAAYRPIAHEIIVVDAPGLATANLRSLPFRRLPRPFYPFDETWDGAPWDSKKQNRTRAKGLPRRRPPSPEDHP
jgi:microcystin degradation protein MlrC